MKKMSTFTALLIFIFNSPAFSVSNDTPSGKTQQTQGEKKYEEKKNKPKAKQDVKGDTGKVLTS